LHAALQLLARPEAISALSEINRGIEKESLRITPEGKLAQTPHPQALGSALTHSSITTDYSEALLEFITPVKSSIEESLKDLEDIHSFTYQQLGDEMLWCTSMPCIVAGDESIPVAQYGKSNVARMKTVYRYGLGHRYGRAMQAIAGVHYNWSMPESYWDMAWEEAGSPGERQDYVTDRYLGLIRNFRKHSWLLIYLFGASPAVCSTFLKGREDHGLESFDEQGRSLYLPYGTALRMGDLGYNSAAQKNLNICYNSLDNYIETLSSAIMQPHPAYASIPSGENDNYQQLNNCLLQIENEFYSPIRPKRVAMSGETALSALVREGIEYIEVRCVDVSPFSPVGIDLEQTRFLDTFLLLCLLDESQPCDDEQQAEMDRNLEAVVNRGRMPDLTLEVNGKAEPMTELAEALLEKMRPIAALLDEATSADAHLSSLKLQRDQIAGPELTPSARILDEMRKQDLPFFRLAKKYSEQWAEYFRNRKLDPALAEKFADESARSLEAQLAIEKADNLGFKQYLETYFAQYKLLSE
jgi:glutamate--cysteine ligase